MILREIVLEETEKSKRDLIQRNLGKQVILNDEHNDWCHGVLLREGHDNEVYQMQIADGRGKRRLYYHDLKQFLLIGYSTK